MAKMDWEKANRSKPKSKRESERWKEVKGTFEKATKAQKKLIRRYKMFPHDMVSNLSKSAASNIISKYAKEHGWENK